MQTPLALNQGLVAEYFFSDVPEQNGNALRDRVGMDIEPYFLAQHRKTLLQRDGNALIHDAFVSFAGLHLFGRRPHIPVDLSEDF